MSNTLKEGDRVQYISKDDYGIDITGILNSIDTDYRAFIFSENDIENTGIKKNDLVKVLLKDGKLERVST